MRASRIPYWNKTLSMVLIRLIRPLVNVNANVNGNGKSLSLSLSIVVGTTSTSTNGSDFEIAVVAD